MRAVFLLLTMTAFRVAVAQEQKQSKSIQLKNQHISVTISGQGVIREFLHMDNGKTDTISFCKDSHQGPSFDSVILSQTRKKLPVYYGTRNSISYQLEYKLNGVALMVIATIGNLSKEEFRPDAVSLRLGINNYQDSFPRWRGILFPTLLRSEKTHFWGYFMSPSGLLLTIDSPNPIPSWSLDYMRRDDFPYYRYLHRVHTTTLDLMRAEILRERQPQIKKSLAPGVKITDTIYLAPIRSLSELNSTIAAQTNAPFISLDRYTLFPGETTTASIISTSPVNKITIVQEGSEQSIPLSFEESAPGSYRFKWVAPDAESRYIIKISNQANKQSEAIVYVRANWSAYLAQARKSALVYLPTTTSNTEAFYPLYTYFLARKHMPDSALDRLTEQVYNTIFPVLFDDKTKEIREGKWRIQNFSNMAAILADRYAVTHDTNDLANAHGLLEYLMRNQGADGGYYSPRPDHNEHYSGVNYVVKTFMEVITQEYKLAQTSEVWKQRYNKGIASLERAMNDLYVRKDNMGTEGLMSFDDTFVSCSLGQLAMGALRTPDTAKRRMYTNVALEMYNFHRCLTLQKIPDARMNGATLRFWEAQYTINMMHHTMNSPCGWSAWKIYGTYYLYLLTGEKGYLYETMNALGTCSQLFNLKDGTLYFAFTPDPYIRDFQYKQAFEGTRLPTLQSVTIGEQYLPCISNWHTAPYYAWRPGIFGIDNFVHEVIKCMEEVALQQAYIIENADGSFETFNCSLVSKDDILLVTPFEKYIKSIHVNFTKPHDVDVVRSGVTIRYSKVNGLFWLGEVPEDIRVYGKL